MHQRKLTATKRQRPWLLAASILVVTLGGCAATPTPSPTSATGWADEGYFRALASCLREAGFDAVVNTSERSISVDSLTDQQRPAFIEAKGGCEERIGPPPSAAPLNESQVRDQYRLLVSARDCLIALGYSISEPPSEEVFVETWSTGPWSPYAEVIDVANSEEWVELNQECPQP